MKPIISALFVFFVTFPKMLNRENCEIAINAIDAFAIEGLDISARGLQRVIFNRDQLTTPEIVYQLKPRDYDATPLQLERIFEYLKQGEL